MAAAQQVPSLSCYNTDSLTSDTEACKTMWNACKYVCVCMYVCLYIYMSVSMYVCVYLYVCMYVCL